MSRLLWSRGGLTVLWLAVIGGGVHALFSYQTAPGQAGEPAVRWPELSSLRPDARKHTLVHFLHPHCPCSRRNVDEISRLLARSGEQLDVYIIFVTPSAAPADWEKTGLWEQASALAGAHVLVDHGGTEAGLFGTKSSGHTVLFDQHSQLRFSGGLLRAGGHGDDHPGCRIVLGLLENTDLPAQRSPVYGCPLLSEQAEDEACSKGGVDCPR